MAVPTIGLNIQSMMTVFTLLQGVAFHAGFGKAFFKSPSISSDKLTIPSSDNIFSPFIEQLHVTRTHLRYRKHTKLF